MRVKMPPRAAKPERGSSTTVVLPGARWNSTPYLTAFTIGVLKVMSYSISAP
jgi:hypothetical protein